MNIYEHHVVIKTNIAILRLKADQQKLIEQSFTLGEEPAIAWVAEPTVRLGYAVAEEAVGNQ